MEASSMEESKKLEDAKLTSAEAFVEGGIQDACDDACSICLEEFCDSDPSTLTGCKHEFHLQCILEWCQRSSQCPMCWQPISLKDPNSQELLDAVVQERNIRLNPPRNTAIFHHPALGNFEIQHLGVGVNDGELEERIIQHLAAMGRARNYGRREGIRSRSSSTQGRPHFMVFSSHPNAQGGSVSSDGGHAETTTSVGPVATPSLPPHLSSPHHYPHTHVESSSAISHASPSDSGRSPSQSSPRSQDRAGPSDLQSFSEALKSRLNSMSMRYKESISKSTKGWKERWFSRNSPISDLSSEVRREVNAGIATVSRMMERLETRESGRSSDESVPNSSESSQTRNSITQHEGNSVVLPGENSLSDNRTLAPFATRSNSE